MENEQVYQAHEGMYYVFQGFEYKVGPKCDDSLASGTWICTTHEETFPHNWAMQSHCEEGEHTIAWICHPHGPEVP